MKTDHKTRSALLDELESAGVICSAADAIVRETAPIRHAHRIETAYATALAESDRIFGAAIRRDAADMGEETGTFASDQIRALAAMLCILDAAGVGGRDKVEGVGTARIPQFAGLGKGRKQALDGGAWSAAIAEAAERLLPGAALYCPGGRYIGVSNNNIGRTVEVETSATMSVADFQAAGLAPWAMTLAREGLRLSLGLAPWLDGRGIRFKDAGEPDAPAAWAQVVNDLAAEIALAERLDRIQASEAQETFAKWEGDCREDQG
jgi:hypothetical protein